MKLIQISDRSTNKEDDFIANEKLKNLPNAIAHDKSVHQISR